TASKIWSPVPSNSPQPGVTEILLRIVCWQGPIGYGRLKFLDCAVTATAPGNLAILLAIRHASPLRFGTKHGRWRFQQGRAGDRFQLMLVKGELKMPLNPNTAMLLRRIETMPLATYQPGETVIAAGTKTGRLLILKKGAVTIRKNGTVIADVTEPGAVIGELSALLNQPHTADVQTLETSEFRVAQADLLVEDPVVLLYVAAILAQRLNLANDTIIELKSELGRQRALSS